MFQLIVYFILPCLLQERNGKPSFASQATSWEHLSLVLEKEVPLLLFSYFKLNIFLWDVGTLQVETAGQSQPQPDRGDVM